VNKKSEPAAVAGAAPLESVKASVHSDLQYVSIQVDGSTYGGWYRVLPDGQMELLALANMHCERRPENSPVEQARGMLSDFIRRARKPKINGVAGTLGGLLYADTAKSRVSEQDWVGLIALVADGKPAALRELYEHVHRIVFTLLVRLTHSESVAGDLTIDVFHDVWRSADKYVAANGSVLGWIMDRTRSKAIDHWGLDWGKRAIARAREAQSHWPAEVLSPSPALWERLAERIALTTNLAAASEALSWAQPEWEDVAPGISCKLLATDVEKDRVAMLVRLAPGTDYPPHTHAGVEELHLLQGELFIDARKISAGDYNRAEPGTADKRVWSETGCMCVLITSARDSLG
jgi:DNA-directed RNA polymerase specialized sigma24 family protein